MDKKLLGRRLNIARKDRGLTSERLSEMCGLNATYLRQIEAGTKTPSLPVFVLLCEKLQVSPSYLLADSLSADRTQEIESLIDLCQQATPKQIEIITAMIKCALTMLDKGSM